MGTRRSCRLAASFLLLCAAHLALAQGGAGTLTGVVIDGASGKALTGAVVVATSPAAPGPRTGVTDALGAFTIGDLPAGPYRLAVTLEGYLPEARADLSLGDQVTLRATLALTPEAVRLEEVLVTGSRVRRKDLITPAPVTVISRVQLLESGRVSVGEFLQALPEQTGGFNRQFNNGGDGAVRVDLRGLGAWRTLVLVNGRRVVAGGTGANNSVDLNTIPPAAIERIEVLKDGASPIYGSDAIGGVVNVITRKSWSGTEITTHGGTSSQGDGGTFDANFATGQSGDSGGLLFSIGWSEQGAVWAGNRTFSTYAQAYDATGLNSPLGQVGPVRLGSSRVPEGRITVPAGITVPNPTNDPRIDRYNQLVTLYPTAGQFTWNPEAPLGWKPSFPAQEFVLPEDGGDAYNYQPANYLLTPSRRLSLFSSGDTRLGGLGRAFYEATFVQRRSELRFAPDPFATPDTRTVVSASNAYNPFGVELSRVSRRLVELSNRSYEQEVGSLRLLGGVDGRLPAAFGPMEGWTWEASVNYGQTQASETKRGFLRLGRLQDALGPSFNAGTDQDPDWRCGINAASEIAGCVPLDLFHGPGSITPDQAAGLTYDGTASGTNRLTMVNANLGGTLFRLLSDQPIGLALGFEYREVSGTFTPDPITAAGESDTDGMITSTRGTQHAREAYAELSIPIASRLPFAESLEVMAAARVFGYSGFGTDWTWKVGGRWSPVRDVAVRGTLSTAYRAPSIWELHFGSQGGFANIHDPCSGLDANGNPEALISPHCPPGAVPDEQASYLSSAEGNPGLGPERAKVFTVGVVLEPSFARDLSITLDYWGVAVNRAVAFLRDKFLLSTCYPLTPGPVPEFCASAIQRNPESNALTGIIVRPQNLASERAAGLDLAAKYQLATSMGRFGLSFLATWLQHYDVITPDGALIHGKGTYDLSTLGWAGVYPFLRFNAGLTWTNGGLSAGGSVRYVGSFEQCGTSNGYFGPSDPQARCSVDSTYVLPVPGWASADAFLGYRLETAAGQTDLVVGAHNLFDQAPPILYGAGGGGYASDPATYDFLGRYLYFRLTHRL